VMEYIDAVCSRSSHHQTFGPPRPRDGPSRSDSASAPHRPTRRQTDGNRCRLAARSIRTGCVKPAKVEVCCRTRIRSENCMLQSRRLLQGYCRSTYPVFYSILSHYGFMCNVQLFIYCSIILLRSLGRGYDSHRAN